MKKSNLMHFMESENKLNQLAKLMAARPERREDYGSMDAGSYINKKTFDSKESDSVN